MADGEVLMCTSALSSEISVVGVSLVCRSSLFELAHSQEQF
jgi:hypothetical protein